MIKRGMPLSIFALYQRVTHFEDNKHSKGQRIALANAPFDNGDESPKRSDKRVRAPSPDAPFGSPNRRLRRKTSSDPESPVTSNLQPDGNPSETAALPEQVPPAPEQDNVTNRKEEAKKRAEQTSRFASKYHLSIQKL